jgi:PAS domain S-box-containing protein
VPLAVWALLTGLASVGLVAAERVGRADVRQRFDLRVQLASDFVTAYVADLIARERVQAAVFLSDPVVRAADFDRSVGAFGYPAAVLLDADGIALHTTPADPTVVGRDLASRYEHLRRAVRDNEPAVSVVVPSAVRGTPVVAFAVPFDTPSGRRVFSGAVDIAQSPLSSYLTGALPYPVVRLYLVDRVGAVVAANRTGPLGLHTLAAREPALASALTRRPGGHLGTGEQPWYYTSTTVPGTGWILAAAVPEATLYAPLDSNRTGGRAALAAAAVAGLLVAAVSIRAGRNRRQRQVSEQRFRQLFDTSGIGMAITDARGRLLRTNDALCHLLGYAPQALTDRNLTDFTVAGATDPDPDPDSDSDNGKPAGPQLDGGFDEDRRYRHADGRTVHTVQTTSRLRDDTGRAETYATQIIDVTAQRQLEQARDRHRVELAGRAAQLQQANDQLADVIAMLSHDVAQPITTIIAYGETLLQEWAEATDDDKHHTLTRITVNGHRLAQLVREILTIAQLDAGALTARPVRLDVHHAVRDAVTTLDIPVTITAPDHVDAYADPGHLQLILANLLGNAVKYGAPPLSITVRRHHDGVRINVTDHGAGVPPDFVPHLFDRFTRAPTAAGKSGTGLGLYLAHQLADAGGLHLSHQPTRPTGATFTLHLPHHPRPGHRTNRLTDPTPTGQPATTTEPRSFTEGPNTG